MRTIKADSSLVDGYLHMLNNLSNANKLDLISRLSDSIKSNLSPKKSKLESSFSAFHSNKSAEEIIEVIRYSKNFSREIEKF